MAKRPDWFYRQSAVLPYRASSDTPEVLLITSRRRRRWVLPKGVVEPGLTPLDSAIKEAMEEAGIVGEVNARSIGSYSYEKWGGICEVEVFLMLVTTELETWPEAAIRHREWTPFETAARRVEEAELGDLIRRLPMIIQEQNCETPGAKIL